MQLQLGAAMSYDPRQRSANSSGVGVAKLESEIVNTLVPFLKRSFRSGPGRDLVIVPEFGVDNGVCDLALFVVRTKLITRRIRANLLESFATPSQAAILATLMTFPVLRKETLFRHTGLLPKTFRRQLDRLVDADAVRYVKSRQIYRLNPNFKMLFEQAIAIEAKVSKWRKALYQATRYATFAKRTFVALKSESVPAAKRNLSAFRANRVGLIEVDTERRLCKIILSQTRRRPTSRTSLIMANEKLFSHYLNTIRGGGQA